MPNKNSVVFVDNKKYIESFLYSRSESMFEYVKSSSSVYTMWYKSLNHSDLLTKGKRTASSDGFDKNLLYYLSTDDMTNLQEQNPDHKFECAKQSNIGMPEDFYTDIGIPKLKRRSGPQKEKHSWVNLNDYMSVYLVNDTLKFFSVSYTEQVMNKLGKKMPENWKEQKVLLNTKEPFTSVDLHEAIHGLGVESDAIFHAVRHSVFLNDTIIFLTEHTEKSKNLFILFEKNPRFYTILGETDTAWEKYIALNRRHEKMKILQNSPLSASEDEKSRRLQNAWKEKLALEMMTYTTEEGKVFCPFTKISADFDAFSMLFVASHIKRHCDCANDKESFNINNGLLLSANADALFDKYMITINEDKELIFSFLLEQDYLLRDNLSLKQSVFSPILNEERMKNIAEHRKIFYEKEEERKKLGR